MTSIVLDSVESRRLLGHRNIFFAICTFTGLLSVRESLSALLPRACAGVNDDMPFDTCNPTDFVS